MKKSIVFKMNTFPVYSETFVVNNIVEAINNGYKVYILATNVNRYSDSSQFELIKKYQLFDKIVHFKSYRKITSKFFAFFNFVNPLLIYFFVKYCFVNKQVKLEFAYHLLNYKKYRRVKAFHIHFANNLGIIKDLKEIGFIKSTIIITFHGFDTFRLPEGKSLKMLLQFYTKNKIYITVNSNYLKSVLVNKGFESKIINVIPMGLDISLFSSKKTKVTKFPIIKLITVARLVPLKGQIYGLKTLKYLRENGYDAIYSIVGEGNSIDDLKKFVVDNELGEYVNFLGKQSQIQIKELFETHDVLLMTSTSDQYGRREAFGLVSLEAQSMGLPVIGFESGGFPETIIDGKTGFIVKDRDFHKMAEAVIQLINFPEQYKIMSQFAKKNIEENFNVNKTFKRFFELYLN